MKLGGIYISVGAKTNQLASDFKKAEGMAAKSAVLMNAHLGKISFNQVKMAALAATASLALIGKAVISAGREFETNMKTVQAWSGASGASLQS